MEKTEYVSVCDTQLELDGAFGSWHLKSQVNFPTTFHFFSIPSPLYNESLCVYNKIIYS